MFLHSHRAALRKAHFVHIAVCLRHAEPYGEYSYAFPGVSDCVCVSAVISLCLYICEHEHLHSISLWGSGATVVGAFFLPSEYTLCVCAAHHCRAKRHSQPQAALRSTLVSPSNLYEEAWRSQVQAFCGDCLISSSCVWGKKNGNAQLRDRMALCVQQWWLDNFVLRPDVRKRCIDHAWEADEDWWLGLD